MTPTGDRFLQLCLPRPRYGTPCLSGPRAADDSLVIAGKRPNDPAQRPAEDLETPVKYFDSWVTRWTLSSFASISRVRRRSSRRVPPEAQRHGRQGEDVTLADLEKLPQHTVPATLECTGNGRAFYTPKVPGIQWGRGAVGTPSGPPRLSDVLKLAGVDEKAPFLEIDGADSGVAQTPDFLRSMPMERRCILHAAGPQDERRIARYPRLSVRLIVPGWDGTSWVKWVVRLTAAPALSTASS